MTDEEAMKIVVDLGTAYGPILCQLPGEILEKILKPEIFTSLKRATQAFDDFESGELNEEQIDNILGIDGPHPIFGELSNEKIIQLIGKDAAGLMGVHIPETKDSRKENKGDS